MATFKTTLKTDQDNRNNYRDANPDLRQTNEPLTYLRVDYTCAGTEVANDDIELMVVQRQSIRVIPEQSYVMDQGNTGDVDVDLTLEHKTGTSGTPTAVSGAAALDNNAAAFASLAPVALPLIPVGDILQATVGATPVMTAGEVITFFIAYLPVNHC